MRYLTRTAKIIVGSRQEARANYAAGHKAAPPVDQTERRQKDKGTVQNPNPVTSFPFLRLNVANVSQSNAAYGANIAVGSPYATQTLVQAQSNSATVLQY